MRIIKKLSNKIKHLENGKILIDGYGYCYAFDKKDCLYCWSLENQWHYIDSPWEIWDTLNSDLGLADYEEEEEIVSKVSKLISLRIKD